MWGLLAFGLRYLKDFHLLAQCTLGVDCTLANIGTNPPSLAQIFNQLKTVFNNFAYPLAPIVIAVMVVYGGIQRALAADTPQNVARANATLVWALIGAVVLVSLTLLINLTASIVTTDPGVHIP